MNYIKICIGAEQQEKKDFLVASLSEIGFEGFEETARTLNAFIPVPDFDEQLLSNTIQPWSSEYTKELIPEQNWNALWEQDFQPVYINEFCGIRASFHPKKESVLHDIVITPKMSFGTGHHATTYLMIEWMETLDFNQKAVVDFGTGTGLLAILAEKLGATTTIAIDNDDWSIENAVENISENNCSKITVQLADQLNLTSQFDIILANINKNVLVSQLPLLKQHLKPGGVIIMSGLLSGDRSNIEEVASQNNLVITGQKEKNGWIALQLK